MGNKNLIIDRKIYYMSIYGVGSPTSSVRAPARESNFWDFKVQCPIMESNFELFQFESRLRSQIYAKRFVAFFKNLIESPHSS